MSVLKNNKSISKEFNVFKSEYIILVEEINLLKHNELYILGIINLYNFKII